MNDQDPEGHEVVRCREGTVDVSQAMHDGNALDEIARHFAGRRPLGGRKMLDLLNTIESLVRETGRLDDEPDCRACRKDGGS